MQWHRTEKQRGDGAGPHCGEGEASCQNPCWELGEVRQYMGGSSNVRDSRTRGTNTQHRPRAAQKARKTHRGQPVLAAGME